MLIGIKPFAAQSRATNLAVDLRLTGDPYVLSIFDSVSMPISLSHVDR